MSTAKLKTNVYFEVEDLQINVRNIINSIKSAWLAMDKKASDLKDLTIYVKAEDKKAYFVGNDCAVSGSVTLSNAMDLSDSVSFEKC